MSRCFLAQFSIEPCDGRLVRCHLIPKRRLKEMWKAVYESAYGDPTGALERALRPYLTPADLYLDPRVWVRGCGGPLGNGGHHGMLDHSRTLRIPRTALPEGTEEIARELGLTHFLDREYGER